MSAFKGTPGPWIVVDMGGGSHPFYVRHEYRRRGGPNLHGSAGAVAKLPSSKFHNAAANARLIAAAPTMHEYIAKRADAGDNEAKQILESINAGR